MAEQVSVVLSGIGGYGELYVESVLKSSDLRLVGVIDPMAENCKYWEQIKNTVNRYDSLESFYQKEQADLCVISAPIQFHAPQTCYALEHGSLVLCEKPAAATPQEIRRMIKSQEETGKHCDIGYQWSHSVAIQSLKKIILSGALGKAICMKAMVHWPRNAAYYARSTWPGKVFDAHGNYILDSVASNATAHYLHNMYYVLGDAMDTSAFPVSLEAELYRTNPIETFDTCMVRAVTSAGTQILYYASHAVKDQHNPPDFHYTFEHGEVVYPKSKEEKVIQIRFADGKTQDLGDPFLDQDRKIYWAADVVRGIGEALPCPPIAAMPLTLSVCAMHRSCPAVIEFPQELRLQREDYTYIEGLNQVVFDCYQQGVLPYDLGISYARQGEKVQITPNDTFEGVTIL